VARASRHGHALRGNCRGALLEPKDREVQRVLLAIDRKTTVDYIKDADLDADTAVLPSLDEFRALYREVPEALYENERVVEMASYDHLFNGFLFPRYETDEPGGAAGLLRREVFEGAVRRYGSASVVDPEFLSLEVRARIEYELGIITQKGFADYFLTVRDIARRASRTCGRGSAAASIVSYCLGIHRCRSDSL